jgi:hypothetical protein
MRHNAVYVEQKCEILTTDFPLHLFAQWLLSHFCNSEFPIKWNHTKIKKEKHSRNDREDYKKVKYVYFKEGDVITLFPGELLRQFPNPSQKEIGSEVIACELCKQIHALLINDISL